MKNYVHIKSTIPSQISINGENIISEHVDISCSRDFYIAFFPKTVERYLPSATSFYGDIRPKSIEKIPYKDNHYDIIFNPTVVPTHHNESTILNKKYNNTIINVRNSNKSFISITSPHFSHLSTCDLICNIQLKTLDGYCIIIGKISENKEYLMILNSKKNTIIIENTFTKIEVTSGSIKALRHNNSVCGYGTVHEFNLNSKILSKYHIFINKSPNKITTNELIPLALLESVKYGDLKTAKTYLSNDNISNDHIINYFGNINEIYFNPYSKDINYTILSDKYKSFTFYVENGKILDIEENQLNLV